jgi:predicted NACHT family NTPase
VADFNSKQIEDFAKNWFVAFAKDNREKGLALASEFIEKLNRPENQQIRELAVTPILLNLTCLVFQAKGDFPSKRSKLYEQGLDILLRRWDEDKGIKRDKIYRDLDVEHKKELLSQVAAITFEQGDYFFEQNKIQGCIADYLCTLPNAKTDRARLQRDSEAVLKSIEAQHGLLVERARGIYSFSHLTFQEYFTAKYFVESSEPQALENLSSHITEKRWREVFLLTTEMLPNVQG